MASSGLELQLGDIVHVVAPRNDTIGDAPLLVKGFGKTWVRLVGQDGRSVDLPLSPDGGIEDESVESIELLSRADEPGYARQNGLVPGAWIDLHFGGDVPITITGQVTDIDEDQVEIRTLDGGNPLYIDFAYKGIPEDIPLERIHLRDGAPELVKGREGEPDPVVVSPVEGSQPSGNMEGADIDDDEFGELPEDTPRLDIREEGLDPDEIVLGAELGTVRQVVDVPEGERRFGIAKQTTDMLDDLLSALPSARRTPAEINAIHVLIERFKQLRTEYSTFDAGNHVTGALTRGKDHKPLVTVLQSFDTAVPWAIPISVNRKKLYDVEEAEAEEYGDIASISWSESRAEEDRIISSYEHNTTVDSGSRYDALLQSLAPLLRPWVPPTEMPGNALATARVSGPLTSVVDNLEDFDSSVFSDREIGRHRFFMQPHSPGLDVLAVVTHRGGEKTYTRRTVTQGDPITATGLLTLPADAIALSRASLPASKIGVRVSLAPQAAYSAGSLDADTVVSTEYVNGEEKGGSIKSLLGSVVQHLPEGSAEAAGWAAFLDAALPTTKSVIEGWLPTRPFPALSAHSAVQWLEPFRVYHRDIHVSDYPILVRQVTNAQAEYKDAYARGRRDLEASLGSGSRRSKQPLPFLLRTISAEVGNELAAEVERAYGLPRHALRGMMDGEMMVRMRRVDGGSLLMMVLARASVKLLMGNAEAEAERVVMRAEAEAELATSSSPKCALPVLAKRYLAEDEMREDDGRAAFFDRNLDPTYYDVLPGYEDKLARAQSASERQQLLESALGERVGLRGADARREAAALLSGSRAVEDGDYAVVEPEGSEGPATYYRRQGQAWVSAPDVTRQTFERTPKVACALKPDCVAGPVGEASGAICMPTPAARAALAADDLAAIEREFDLALEKDVAARRRAAERGYAAALSRVTSLRRLDVSLHLRIQRQRSELGATAATNVSKRSPHAPLRDLILGQGDLAKRQSNVAEFVARFTRPPRTEDGEDQWWLYCASSGLKLLPRFLGTLAEAFMAGRDYLAVARRICAEQGTISDDGDAWVDKHSGYSIVPIDYDDDEGYTEAGFKVQTRAVLEEDLGVGPSEEPTGASRFSDPIAKRVATVAVGLAGFMGVPVESSLDFIVRISTDRMANVLPSRTKYDKLVEAKKARGKKNMATYDEFAGEVLVLLTSSVTLLAIQTQVPGVIPAKRHPGCPASLEGYPAGQESDLGAVKYVACVLRSISKSVPPWNSVRGVSTATLVKKLQRWLSGHVLTQPGVAERIAERKEFDRLNPALADGRDPGLVGWIGFLPPLDPVKVAHVEGLTPALQRTIEADMRRGSPDQTNKINMLRGREIMTALKIQELIEKTVETKGLSLANSAGEPFLENSCCDELPRNPLAYFSKAQPGIIEKNSSAAHIRDYLDYLGAMARAPMLFDPSDTRRRYPALPPGFSEATIYQAFIVFCKYNSSVQASAKLRAVCMERPAALNAGASIDEKIATLKAEGHNYSEKSLDALMRVINEDNIVHLELGRVALTTAQDLRSTLADPSVGVPDSVKEALDIALSPRGEPAGFAEDDRARALRNILAREIDNSEKEVKGFLGRFQKTRAAAKAAECFSGLARPQTEGAHGADGIALARNWLHLLVRVFPNIVLNRVDYAKVDSPKHWKLSLRHESDVRLFIARYYNPLAPFYGDVRLVPLLNAFRENGLGHVTLLNRLHPGPGGSALNRRTADLLARYLVVSAMGDYVELATRSPEIARQAAAARNAALDLGEATEGASTLGAQEALATRAAALLTAMIGIMCEEQSLTDLPYADLMRRVHRAKEREKDLYTTRLGSMTDEERSADNAMKREKLGRWGRGLQKGMRAYDKDTYDQEVTEMEDQALLEIRMGQQHMVTEMNRDIYAMDALAEQAEADRIEAEEMSLAHLGDDDDYGDADGDEHY